MVVELEVFSPNGNRFRTAPHIDRDPMDAVHTDNAVPLQGIIERFLEIHTPEDYMEPENDGLEDDFPFPGVYSQVPC